MSTAFRSVRPLAPALWLLVWLAVPACSRVTPPTAQRPGAGTPPATREAPAAGRPGEARVDVPALERGIVEEMNRARRDPSGYAALIEGTLRWYDGTVYREPGQTTVRTEEGSRAAREAVRVLRALRPVGALGRSDGMSAAARDHVRDQARGATGHVGSDGSTFADRVSRYGEWRTSVSENIAYGPRTPREVVMGLIVDDGVPDRAHRRNMFDPVATVAGVACGPHARYAWVCVIDYAGAFAEGRGRRAQRADQRP